MACTAQSAARMERMVPKFVVVWNNKMNLATDGTTFAGYVKQ